MLVTSQSFENPVALHLGEPGDRYWFLALLATESPWYVVCYRADCEPVLMKQTAIVAWESALRSLIEQVGTARILSLQHLSASATSAGGWAMRTVSEVWTPTSSEQGRTGPLLFAFAGHDGLYDTFSTRVEATVGRRKLFDLQSATPAE